MKIKPEDMTPEQRSAYIREKRAQRAGGRGLGDIVAAVAQPVAAAVDAALGTNLKGCRACAQRREALNRIFPGKPKP
jgi:hypothetical protein